MGLPHKRAREQSSAPSTTRDAADDAEGVRMGHVLHTPPGLHAPVPEGEERLRRHCAG